ncbi:hypothetical protein [Thalassovita sp.]|jgi:hypothetical protein|uniref:hypothetical protein n=1 Tax=Thalassovita sp. TaxID=1979401 RepID=UPI003B5B3C08
MRKSLLTLTVAALVLSGCGNSRLNPFNWFGRGQPAAPVAVSGETNPLIPLGRNGRPLTKEAPYLGAPIAQVTEVRVERVPGGAIVRATGIGHYQQSFDVQLTPLNDGQAVNGTISYRFDAYVPPAGNRVVGAPSSRQLTAAAFLTDNELAGVRKIRVESKGNALESRR